VSRQLDKELKRSQFDRTIRDKAAHVVFECGPEHLKLGRTKLADRSLVDARQRLVLLLLLMVVVVVVLVVLVVVAVVVAVVVVVVVVAMSLLALIEMLH
jgi:uncharacterized membrane protein